VADHLNHRIEVKPIFRIEKAGTSGPAEPNWALAPTAGDTLEDGTCVWENTGMVNVRCLTCRRALSNDEYNSIRSGLQPIWPRR
jgi:hypothetical protein